MPTGSGPAWLAELWDTDRSTRRPKCTANRVCTAEATFTRIEPLLAPAGITRIADVTGLDCLGIPVALVMRPNSRSLSVAQGKGLDFAAAKVSGAMEALESFHAERLDLPIRLMRWSELADTGRAVDPSRLPRRRTSLFHPDRRLAWATAIDLLSGRERLVPLELVHTDFTLPAAPGAGCFPVSSNGLASGNTFAEAVVHGICELIERDAHAVCQSRGGLSGRRVLLDTVSDPGLRSLIERIEGAGCRLAVDEITSDLGVAVFSAAISGGAEAPVTAAPAGGFGCHPDRIWACVRAITEAAQSRLTRISGSRDDLTPGWFRLAPPVPAAPAAANERGMQPFDAGPDFRGDTVEDDLRWLIDRLAQRGMDEVLVVDLSRPEFRVPVVRVLVPGLEFPPGHDVLPGSRAISPQ